MQAARVRVCVTPQDVAVVREAYQLYGTNYAVVHNYIKHIIERRRDCGNFRDVYINGEPSRVRRRIRGIVTTRIQK